jgi:hypothetical protein
MAMQWSAVLRCDGGSRGGGGGSGNSKIRKHGRAHSETGNMDGKFRQKGQNKVRFFQDSEAGNTVMFLILVFLTGFLLVNFQRVSLSR